MPKDKRKKNNTKIEIDYAMMKPYFYCPQTLAARLLGVSISTLKRRFYDLHIGRWPYQCISLSERKKSIYFLMNEVEPENEKELDEKTIHHLKHAFKDASRPILTLNPNQSTQFHLCSFVQQADENKSEESSSCGSGNGMNAPHIGKKVVMREMEMKDTYSATTSNLLQSKSNALSSSDGDNHPPYHHFIHIPMTASTSVKKSHAVDASTTIGEVSVKVSSKHRGVVGTINTSSQVNWPGRNIVGTSNQLLGSSGSSSPPCSPPLSTFGMPYDYSTKGIRLNAIQ